MRKILILAVVALAAVCSQAAATNWKFTAANMKGSTGSDYKGDVQIFAYEHGKDASTAFLAYTFTDVNKSLSNKEFSAADGLFKTDGTTYDMYFVLTDGGKQWESSVKASQTPVTVGTTGLNWGNVATATSSNWQSVPEPTSGLLLLLGVAGLALKRKRA